jgi:quinol monooxygenase YgiN
MYSVMAHVTVQPQHVDEFVTLVREHAREYLRDEPGTLGYDVIQDESTPNHFYFHETYVDEAAFQIHMQGPIGQRYLQRSRPLMSGTPDSSGILGKGLNITPAES